MSSVSASSRFLLDGRASSRRGVAAAAVIALHVGLIYALVHLKVAEPQAAAPQPLMVALLAEQQTPPREAVLPPPPLETAMPSIEPPVINLPDLPPPEQAVTAVARIASTAAEPPAAALAPKLISVVEYIRRPRPRYPEMSRRMRERGIVMVMALIDEVGRACQINVHRSSGFDRLDRAAREAVADAMFKPYVEDGIARPFRVVIPIEFEFNQRIAQR